MKEKFNTSTAESGPKENGFEAVSPALAADGSKPYNIENPCPHIQTT